MVSGESMKTLAAILYEINKPLQIEELNIPEIEAGQVRVKVAYSGICHTQLNEIRGLKGEDKFLPHTLGHEGSGIVEEIGTGVNKVKPGDHVVLTWIKGSGADVPSTLYIKSDSSTVNSGAISTFLTTTVISENRLVKIPNEMPLREAALLGCAIPTGAGIVLNTAKVQSGSIIAIFGIGGIGLSAVLAANSVGASDIIAIDIFDHKLELAQKVGATHLINARQQDPLKTVMEITHGKGVDYAIEAAGQRETMETAFQSVRDNGGLCILAGNLEHGRQISIDPFDLIRGKRIIGTWGGEAQPDRDIPLHVDFYLAGKSNLEALITHEYALKDINQAFDDLEQGKVGRALIDMASLEERE